MRLHLNGFCYIQDMLFRVMLIQYNCPRRFGNLKDVFPRFLGRLGRQIGVPVLAEMPKIMSTSEDRCYIPWVADRRVASWRLARCQNNRSGGLPM